MNIYEYQAKATEFEKLTSTLTNEKFILESVNAIAANYKDKFPLPDFLFYKGYTPGFNDGEPCTHSAYWVDYNELAESYEDDTENLCDTIGFEVSEDVENIDEVCVYDLPINADYTAAVEKMREEYLARTGERYGNHENVIEFEKALQMLDDIIDRTYHTDFLIVFKRNPDGLYTLTEHEYQCGY